jgi:hypothetical protein
MHVSLTSDFFKCLYKDAKVIFYYIETLIMFSIVIFFQVSNCLFFNGS